MKHLASPHPAETLTGWAIDHVRPGVARLAGRIVEILAVHADAWAAAALYENLSKLSDAELERRGIPRGELHHRIFERLVPPGTRDGFVDKDNK